jgi:hypothetical protein
MVLFSRISPLSTRRRAILSQNQNVAYFSYHIDGVFGDDLLDDHVKYYFQDSCPSEQFGVLCLSISKADFGSGFTCAMVAYLRWTTSPFFWL